MSRVLDIRSLRLSFCGWAGETEALRGISLHVSAGERVALVGESGSGKSVTARAVLGLLQESPLVRTSGDLIFEGQDLVSLPPAKWRALRGTAMSMVFQDPTASLNPAFTIESQFREVLRRRNPDIGRAEARARADALIHSVMIPDGERVLASYPFQLSGGMNQRLMIAMALANHPSLLIADEPGTALDVTVQAATLRLMHDLVERSGTAVLFISHNLGVVREFADRVYVIYRGRIVEHGSAEALFQSPGHAYTRALMAAAPRLTGGGMPDIAEDDSAFLAPIVDHAAIT